MYQLELVFQLPVQCVFKYCDVHTYIFIYLYMHVIQSTLTPGHFGIGITKFEYVP